MNGHETAFDRLVDRLTPLGELRLRDDHADARCPAHEDRDPSLSIDRKPGLVLVKCHAGCTIEQVVAALDWTMADLFDDPRQAGGDDDWTPLTKYGGQLVDTYRYVDESGRLLHATARIVMPDGSKQFRQWQPDPSERSGRRWSLNGCRRVIYRLPEVIAAVIGRVIHVVEGEKDVHAVERAGGVATCNPMGAAGKWRHEYAEPLRGAEVVIVADRDEPGIAHARQVAESLTGVAASVRLVQAAEGKDAADHLGAGHRLDAFVPLEDAGEPVAGAEKPPGGG